MATLRNSRKNTFALGAVSFSDLASFVFRSVQFSLLRPLTGQPFSSTVRHQGRVVLYWNRPSWGRSWWCRPRHSILWHVPFRSVRVNFGQAAACVVDMFSLWFVLVSPSSQSRLQWWLGIELLAHCSWPWNCRSCDCCWFKCYQI